MLAPLPGATPMRPGAAVSICYEILFNVMDDLLSICCYGVVYDITKTYIHDNLI